MIMSKDNFYEFLDEFIELPESITSVDEETFQRVYGNEAANVDKNILYIYRTKKPIPRLKGESDIVYIGQTKNTLKQRYFIHAAKLANTEANRMKFEHIVSQYGPIRIMISPFSKFGASLHKAEGQLLWWYFQNHMEYPPVNYTQTKVRNSVVSTV